MKQGYYLYIDNLRGNSLTNKIKMQIKAFNKVLSVKECVLETVHKPLLYRLTNVFPLGAYSRDYTKALNSFVSPDFFYIRMIYLDRDYISFLVGIKTRFPDCKIIEEIPTYPYRREWCSSLYGISMYFKDCIYRKYYKKYIDRFVTYSYDETINGVKTIQTMNGVDVESFIPVKSTRSYDPQCINLIAVAFLMRHHGYERIIKGLSEYYKKKGGDRTVNICIVGDGKEKKKYEHLIKKYNLSKYIKLPGPMYGKDLDEIYDTADAGLSGFGFYKDGVKQVGTLKTREYLAKGLPVILGTDDRVFSVHGYEYGLLFSNNNTPVDIGRVVAFLDGVYLNKDRRDVIRSIREFAKNTVDNSVTLAPVIDYVVNGDS